MTVAVCAAVAEGAEAVICASTGNTAASAAAYAARAGLRGAVIVPEGKIATGKLAQALMHGARVIALRGNFDEALALVRELADSATRSRSSTRSTTTASRARRPARSRSATSSASRPTCSASRSGNAGNVTVLVEGLPGVRGGAAAARLPGRGRGAARARRAGRAARDGGVGDPDRQPGALGGRDERVHRVARRGARGLGRGDPRRLLAARRARGRVLRAGVGGVGGGAAQATAPRGAWSACSPATG